MSTLPKRRRDRVVGVHARAIQPWNPAPRFAPSGAAPEVVGGLDDASRKAIGLALRLVRFIVGTVDHLVLVPGAAAKILRIAYTPMGYILGSGRSAS